ncbi:MAG: hypothetical protein R3222_09580, partial [Balneolaceae bacterium]|nr:hypothetical protein [Balneolaceae bacterium]
KEELKETFELATDIAGKISSFQRAIEQLRSAQKQLKSLTGQLHNEGYANEVREQANSLIADLKELEEEFINNDITSGQDPIGMERRLSNRMGRLYQVVRGHDARPTGGMLERHEDLEKVYEKLMGRYSSLVDEQLKEFNKMLKKYEVPHIRTSNNE